MGPNKAYDSGATAALVQGPNAPPAVVRDSGFSYVCSLHLHMVEYVYERAASHNCQQAGGQG